MMTNTRMVRRNARLILGASIGAGVAAAVVRIHSAVRERNVERMLEKARPTRPFRPELLTDLPVAARRYLLHAIQPGTVLKTTVRLRLDGQMRPREGASRTHLTAEEVLNPFQGLIWKARLKVGPVPIRVTDTYLQGRGSLRVRILDLLPVRIERGPEIARSSRHRAVAESVWIPSILLPSSRVRWSEIDEYRATATVSTDREDVPITLTVDDAGSLKRLDMMRYGNVGVPQWQLIPYGFEVKEERTFGGYTIPSTIRGGWWYGTDRYRDEDAADFNVLYADY